MELKNFIADVLSQLHELKNDSNKSRYIIDDLEFELNINTTESGKIGVSFLGLNGKLNENVTNQQKVKIKLKPKTLKINNINIQS